MVLSLFWALPRIELQSKTCLTLIVKFSWMMMIAWIVKNTSNWQRGMEYLLENRKVALLIMMDWIHFTHLTDFTAKESVTSGYWITSLLHTVPNLHFLSKNSTSKFNLYFELWPGKVNFWAKIKIFGTKIQSFRTHQNIISFFGEKFKYIVKLDFDKIEFTNQNWPFRIVCLGIASSMKLIIYQIRALNDF